MGKNNFFTGQPVFSQLLDLIPRRIVDSISVKHGSNRYCKRFLAFDHLVSMLYAGFFQCTSLRELTTGLQANGARLGHLGLKYAPRRSTLSDANQRRDAVFFEELYHKLYTYHFGLPDSRSKKDKVFIIDSTTVSLFSSIMHGAGSYKSDGRKKGGAKAHVMLDSEHNIPCFISITEARDHDLTFLKKVVVPNNSIVVMDKAYINYKQFGEWSTRGVKWVTRAKEVASYTIQEEHPVDEKSSNLGVQRDLSIRLGRPSNARKTPVIDVRLVEYWDGAKQRSFTFITNDKECEPFQIAELYKRRWQIELLFKRIKQRYPLKYFLGNNPNAIKIQIWAALLCDLLVRIIQLRVNKTKRRPWSYTAISSMIKHHLMTYLKVIEFLANPELTLKDYRPPNQQYQLQL